MRARAESQRPEAGFTLLELLVAAALTLAVAGAVVGVFVGLSRHRRRCEALLETAETARAALGLVARGLEGCYATAYTGGTAYKAFEGPSGSETPSDAKATQADPLVFTTAAENPGSADFCEATYFVAAGELRRELRAPGLGAAHQGAKPLARRVEALYVESAAHAVGEVPAWVKLTIELRDPRLVEPGSASGAPRPQFFTILVRPKAATP